MTTMLAEREEKKEAKALARPWLEFPTFGDRFMRRFMEDMERVFDDVGFGLGWKVPTIGERWGEAIWTPKIDALEKNGQLIVRADLPGLTKEDVKVEVTEEGLKLEGERKLEKEEKREGYYRAERSYGSFYRTVPLPEGAIVEKANAIFKDGVLEVTIPVPKKEGKKGRRLEIRAS